MSEDVRLNDAAKALAKRHVDSPEEIDPAVSIVNFAERPHIGDWTLRSALVRLAQPEPLLAGAVLQLIRRCDAALHSVARSVEKNNDRMADLAGLAEGDPDRLAELLDAYADAADLLGRPVHADETQALPWLLVALELDKVADVLTAWANTGPADPPVADVDAKCRSIYELMEAVGMPQEQGPPTRRGSRGG